MESPNLNTSSNRIAERNVRRVKEGNLACTRNGGLIQWNACYLQNVQDFLGDGKTYSDRRFGALFNAPIISFLEHWLNILRFLHETSPGTKIGKSRSEDIEKQAWGTEKPNL